ncbi:HlyD family efflux transporter periplasmic adaptor subunit [Ramlibacter sp. USB13]|uniref:HlyD family efflux transporter periplasmic adaptor subunit n=1 Tax=Ramlibacter cellulosilyticus TaxID=2764187 RepID=A0A923MND8_9BURK|nr:HlyD family efflux transporter periplasmic adaptor subunit [Ramlibacter cellulosilyticus]MBC5781878.1 HlyD family efflux transporter periplasmic adaptor subunit [Ramlibacter cellulosilyticus]
MPRPGWIPSSLRERPALAALLLAACLPAGCSRGGDAPWSGYAEGDYVYVAAPLAGTLATLRVQAGQQVRQGQPLFSLDAESERAAREEAQARLAAARFQAANTEKGRRPPEIAMTQAQLVQARAQLDLARRELARKTPLGPSGAVSREEIDAARSAVDQAQARVAELEASLRVAQLPSRTDERGAAEAQVEAARQVLRQNAWREAQKGQDAPADAVVSDTFFRPGEFVAAGQPVLSLLPPGNLKARFYVAEAELARIAPGQEVRLSCDGCGHPIAARVSFIATQPEYTPPVIYSNAQRSKLVFLVEARPVSAADATRLRPGQPLDVRPAPRP